MTRRLDRTPDGDKLHQQTLCALGHYDFNQAGGYDDRGHRPQLPPDPSLLKADHSPVQFSSFSPIVLS